MRMLKMAAVIIAALLVGIAWGSTASPSPANRDLAALTAVLPTQSCESLLTADVSAAVGARTVITQAHTVQADHGPVCAVVGNIDPHIGFEMRLPEKGWTQRYLQLGCGGLCGVIHLSIEHANGCVPVDDGQIVVASTDMGHKGSFMGDGSFGADPQARIDFAYRGVHLTSVAAKAVINAFYKHAPKYAYFSGCSDGGREALMEAQRFPGDFDGIAAGAPAMNFQVQNSFYHAWMARSNMDAQGHAILTADKLPILHAAALVACDAADGLKDGQIDDPRRCHFDPGVTMCKAGETDTSHCLTAAQVEVARKFYEGAHDSQGHRFVVGSVQVGSELQWRGVFVPASPTDPIASADMAMGSVRNLVFEKNPPESMTVTDFTFDVATLDRLKPLHGLYDATNPDLRAFVGHGGKLVLWHGWADPHISPLNTIAYYNAVRSVLGHVTDNAVRLFLFPGMGHCMGGDGESQFDVVTPLMQWVEGDHAPAVIVAGRPSFDPMQPMQSVPFPGKPPMAGPGNGPLPPLPPGGLGHGPLPPLPGMVDGQAMPTLPVNRTRPVYPYPQVAHYIGHGSVDDAANFEPVTPAGPEPVIGHWEGEGFYSPDFQKQCHVTNAALVCE